MDHSVLLSGERNALPDHLDERPDQCVRCGRAPVARANDATDQLSLAVDEGRGRGAPHSVELARHVTGGVEKHGSDVASLVGCLLDGLGAVAEGHQQDLEALALELSVQPIDGR